MEAPIEQQKQFLKEYQDFDKTLGAVKTYNEFSDSDLEDKYGLDDMFIEDLHAAYEVVKDNVKTAEGGNDNEDTAMIQITNWKMPALKRSITHISFN